MLTFLNVAAFLQTDEFSRHESTISTHGVYYSGLTTLLNENFYVFIFIFKHINVFCTQRHLKFQYLSFFLGYSNAMFSKQIVADSCISDLFFVIFVNFMWIFADHSLVFLFIDYSRIFVSYRKGCHSSIFTTNFYRSRIWEQFPIPWHWDGLNYSSFCCNSSSLYSYSWDAIILLGESVLLLSQFFLLLIH